MKIYIMHKDTTITCLKKRIILTNVRKLYRKNVTWINDCLTQYPRAGWLTVFNIQSYQSSVYFTGQSFISYIKSCSRSPVGPSTGEFYKRKFS